MKKKEQPSCNNKVSMSNMELENYIPTENISDNEDLKNNVDEI